MLAHIRNNHIQQPLLGSSVEHSEALQRAEALLKKLEKRLEEKHSENEDSAKQQMTKQPPPTETNHNLNHQ